MTFIQKRIRIQTELQLEFIIFIRHPSQKHARSRDRLDPHMRANSANGSREGTVHCRRRAQGRVLFASEVASTPPLHQNPSRFQTSRSTAVKMAQAPVKKVPIHLQVGLPLFKLAIRGHWRVFANTPYRFSRDARRPVVSLVR